MEIRKWIPLTWTSWRRKVSVSSGLTPPVLCAPRPGPGSNEFNRESMEIYEPKLTKKDIDHLRKRVLCLLGYRASETHDMNIEEILNNVLDEVDNYATPRGMFRSLRLLETTDRGIRIEAGHIQSAMLARMGTMCKGDASVVIMVATVGEQLQKIRGSCMPLLTQFIVDTVESELAGMFADMLEEYCRNCAYHSHLQFSHRFSPGHCDIDPSQQQVIFNVLDTDRIGVSLNSAMVMSPIKSVSAVAIQAREVLVKAPCFFCPRDCQWRRIPFQEV